MSLKVKRKLLLWFHAEDVTQAQVVAITEAHAAYQVCFRKVVRDVNRDTLEEFDAVGGDVPQRYINQAALQGATVYGKSHEVFDESIADVSGTAGSSVGSDETGLASKPATQTTQETAKAAKSTTVAPPNVPAPSDAPAAAAPAAPSKTVPPPPAN